MPIGINASSRKEEILTEALICFNWASEVEGYEWLTILIQENVDNGQTLQNEAKAIEVFENYYSTRKRRAF